MASEIPERVTCEVCGTSYDPRESRGWCPNPSCGKWQHPAFPLSSDADRGAADGGVDAPRKDCPKCGKEIRADANFCKFCSYEFEDEPETDGSSGESTPGLDTCPDCKADLSSIPPERLSEGCPICGTDLKGVMAEQSTPEVTPADLSACPACDADLTNIPADMRMICPECRTDLETAIAEHGVGGDAVPAAPDPEEDPATAPVDTVSGIGESYAGRLADAGVETVGELVASNPASLAAATDISEKRIAEWIDSAPVPARPPADGEQPAAAGGESGVTAQTGADATSGAGTAGEAVGDPAGGAGGVTDRPEEPAGAPSQAGGGREGAGTAGSTGTADSGRQDPLDQETGIRRTYDTVVFEIQGKEIRASPGETVGRDVRTAMVEGGAEKEDAVYVHREHVRVERDGDTFYVVRLGQNSFKVNDEPVDQGARVPIHEGDAVSFSEVVSGTVHLE